MGFQDFGSDAEPDAHAALLFAVKKLRRPSQRGGGKTGASVAETERRAGASDAQFAAASHCVNGVHQHVRDGLAESTAIRHHRHASDFRNDAHFRMSSGRRDGADVLRDKVREVAWRDCGRLRASEEHPLIYERFDLRILGQNHGERFVWRVRFEQLRVELYRADGVVDFVREPRRHAAQRGEALGLLASAALCGKLLACALVSAGELADFVRARGFRERFRIFLRDVRQSLR